MTKQQPVSSQNTTPADHLQTWSLRVYIHCEGCKKKVFKVLQSIDGVYKTVIDAKEHKVTVTGSVSGETLVQKLQKSGKQAEILPESFNVMMSVDNKASGNSKKKKKQSIKQNEEVVVTKTLNSEGVTGEKESKEKESKDEIIVTVTKKAGGGNNQQTTDPTVTTGSSDTNETCGDEKKKKNKKKKGATNNKNAPTNPLAENITTNPLAEDASPSLEQLNLGRQTPQMVYPQPYDVPAYHSYYPTPAYGVSYNTSYPSAESSYYSPPVYGYAQSHPSVVVPPPMNYSRSAFDDHDDEGGEGKWCTIM